ncbi:phosphoribosylanthranilate isomerase [Paenibacillus cymbidii]|uniref:phosphoribosylanthranilate isomerase n=1 Tax=Paenibacillus cymbidii TaxID=1639034 RepID=UPI001081C4DB|nr:phosphoribosylanthranilate isomerase [Paenibacillus cymbidii]
MATVKICGIRAPETARELNRLQLPIDHVGFLFAPSKRQVTPRQAGELIALLRGDGGAAAGPLAVGVFVEPTEELLRETLAEAPLDVLQLHGNETPAFCRQVRETFGLAVFKVVSVASGGEPEADPLEAVEPYRGAVDAILLDTHDPLLGGTGRTFAWERIPAYAAWAADAGVKLLVAGGLRPDNVDELLREYRPDGVDVSSGVETDGHKDIAKIKQFVERVKR